MIYQSLKFLAGQMNAYMEEVIQPSENLSNPIVILDNIANIDDENRDSTNNILLTLINIYEEASMKNNPASTLVNNELTRYQNPPVNLNLHLLLTSCMANYELSLRYLSHAIAFFQGKKTFTRQNSFSDDTSLPDDLRLILDLQTLSLEQVNNIWSTLGGKQKPFVCYKLRMVRIEKDSTLETRGIITNINLTESGI
ncbi:MAG: DUF4255 domain-containing protein [Bacteroidetes bacterium]|nr:MAG: DUF4255 domain-containing protein [Bacteroidota bacterium]